MPQTWSDDAIRHLTDANTCPRCGVDALHERRCLNCGADLQGEVAERLWAASVAAADALRARQAVLEEVPVAPVEAPAAAGVAAPTSAEPAAAVPAAAAVAAPERTSATVQSVLAVAGAGLFAVAGIVFTFLNPELTDEVLRSVIVAGITMLFLAGAWVLARRSLQFSAEAVGALGMVFVALDVYAVSELAHPPTSPWVFAAIGTLVSGIAMVAFAVLARIRSWLFLALLGLAVVPAMLGYAGLEGDAGVWASVLGHLGAAFGVLGLLEGARVLARRFGGTLTADRVALQVLQLLAATVVVIQLPFTEAATQTAHWLGVAATLAALAVLAVLSTRHRLAPFWSFVAGGFAVAAIAVLPFSLDLEPHWHLALVPSAAAVALIALGVLPALRTVHRPLLTAGVLTVAGAASFLTLLLGGGLVLLRAASVLQASDYRQGDLFGDEGGIAVVLGLGALALGLGAYAVAGTRRAGSFAPGYRIAACAAVSVLMLGALTFAVWSAWLTVTQVGIALAVALATALAVLLIPAVRTSSLALRIPAIAGAHVALVLGAVLSWSDEPSALPLGLSLPVVAGIAVVTILVLLAFTIRTADHPIHVGTGYAYALVLFAHALDLTDVFSTVALLSLTTAVGAVAAIAATLMPRVRVPAWYAVLIVTAVPFLIGVAVVFVSRSGWAALASGLIFLLALTLLLTRRAGLGVPLRAIAAGLLVPTLAVVVTNLAAEFLDDSGPFARRTPQRRAAKRDARL